jgi:ectoine hydroxylase-related dioxygenase (phytanoyl-CoA dioxygenase family)
VNVSRVFEIVGPPFAIAMKTGHMLERDGYLVLPGFMSKSLLARLRQRTDELFAIEGERAGSEFRKEENANRLANLVAKGRVFEEIVCMPVILDHVTQILGPGFKLSSLNARTAPPRSDSHQPLHVDGGLLPDERGDAVCNTVWMLDDFTPENGALRVVPGSHRWGRKPDRDEVHPDEMLITGRAGTVVVMNAHMWHGGTANRTDMPRCAVHGFYCRSDIAQQQYQKALIPQNVQARFSPELRAILALDDPLNDELSSSMTMASGFLK